MDDMSRHGTDRDLDHDGDRDSDLTVYQTILDTLTGPRVVWRGGEPAVDLSAFERPFAPALAPSGAGLVSRRASG